MPAMQSRPVTSLWRTERRARWFFAAHLQGALGTGAGYVALLLLAYEQLGSAWGATAVLIADLAPAMLLGPLLGGLIDRTSRLGCAIAAELIGALAFAGLLFADSTLMLVAFALAAGLGSALLRPATCALLPAVVTPASLSAANGLFGAVREIGQLLGPALAAGLLLLAEPELVLALNAVTFALSAFLMTRLRGHVEPGTPDTAADQAGPSNVIGVLKEPFTRSLVLTSGAVMLVAGATNVAELVLARDQLGGGSSGFALLVAAFGCGMLTGSLSGARSDDKLRGRYLLAIALLGAGLLGTAAAPGAAAGDAGLRGRRRRQRALPGHRPRADAEADPGGRPRPRLRPAGRDRLLGLRRRDRRRRSTRGEPRRPRDLRHRRSARAGRALHRRPRRAPRHPELRPQAHPIDVKEADMGRKW